MKKLKWIVLLGLLLLAASVICLACGKKEEGAEVIDIGAQNGESDTSSSAMQRGEKTEGAKQSGTGGAQMGKSEQGGVIGRVESIVGNEATMTLLKSGDAGEYTETGEEGVYLIPVGLSVGSGDYSSVSAGMVLSLNIEDDTVMSVRILKRAS